ncbi:hypothetical protein [Mucilaginibacter myungsuensis]|uniref:Uncharacterized protein n=1 Tax=Mucilaginibacter myungsuensis TaxID=649104 RepID=A0A929L2K5_9SPHI|nr:hypothetical protein [Mucilaginibacter myungsuensis]MBE9664478.1 hypothetical protein [Mucilaginibacter myungsuensis]MDN3601377.1 hypothetical protein [Mucilaginibacter myungsuensis]
MATITSAPATWAKPETQKTANLWNKFMAFADTQNKNRTLWFLVSLVSQGVLFLPIPAVLIFYFDAPELILAVTLILFFLNVVAGMGGSSIRTMLTLFATSAIINTLMILIFTI